jgi:hypothetical protein
LRREAGFLGDFAVSRACSRGFPDEAVKSSRPDESIGFAVSLGHFQLGVPGQNAHGLDLISECDIFLASRGRCLEDLNT